MEQVKLSNAVLARVRSIERNSGGYASIAAWEREAGSAHIRNSIDQVPCIMNNSFYVSRICSCDLSTGSIMQITLQGSTSHRESLPGVEVSATHAGVGVHAVRKKLNRIGDNNRYALRMRDQKISFSRVVHAGALLRVLHARDSGLWRSSQT